MKAVILCAGKSTRTYPITLSRPKPLLPFGEQTLLAHNLQQLNGIVAEVYLVVGYRSESIKKVIGTSFEQMTITFVDQKEQKGTGHALLQIPQQQEPLLVLMGDDLYTAADLQQLSKHHAAILGASVANPERFGLLTIADNKLKDIQEKPEQPEGNIANTGAYLLPSEIFQLLSTLKPSPRGEIELTDAIKALARKRPVHVIHATAWCPIGYPQDILKAIAIFQPDGYIHPNATVTGCAVNSIICAGSVVEGEVLDSIVFPNTTIDAASRIERSVLGENVRLTNVQATVENHAFGSVIGDSCNISNAVISPETIIWPERKLSGELKGTINDE